jgi:hypothetical protein
VWREGQRERARENKSALQMRDTRVQAHTHTALQRGLIAANTRAGSRDRDLFVTRDLMDTQGGAADLAAYASRHDLDLDLLLVFLLFRVSGLGVSSLGFGVRV